MQGTNFICSDTCHYDRLRWCDFFSLFSGYIIRKHLRDHFDTPDRSLALFFPSWFYFLFVFPIVVCTIPMHSAPGMMVMIIWAVGGVARGGSKGVTMVWGSDGPCVFPKWELPFFVIDCLLVPVVLVQLSLDYTYMVAEDNRSNHVTRVWCTDTVQELCSAVAHDELGDACLRCVHWSIMTLSLAEIDVRIHSRTFSPEKSTSFRPNVACIVTVLFLWRNPPNFFTKNSQFFIKDHNFP